MIPVDTRDGVATNLGSTYSDKWCNKVALYSRVVHVVAGVSRVVTCSSTGGIPVVVPHSCP
jgi:hypothetical protein